MSTIIIGNMDYIVTFSPNHLTIFTWIVGISFFFGWIGSKMSSLFTGMNYNGADALKYKEGKKEQGLMLCGMAIFLLASIFFGVEVKELVSHMTASNNAVIVSEPIATIVRMGIAHIPIVAVVLAYLCVIKFTQVNDKKNSTSKAKGGK